MKNKNLDHEAQDTTSYNRHLMNNVNRLPLEIGMASGNLIHDAVAGVDMMDFFGDGGVLSLGYNTPEVIGALQDWIESGQPHQLPDIYPNKVRWHAAELLCQRTGMDKVFFASSGTEAVEAAIKLVRKYWCDKLDYTPEHIGDGGPRHLVLTIEDNIHGRTGHSLAACDNRNSPYHKQRFGPFAKGFGVLAPVHEWDEPTLNIVDMDTSPVIPPKSPKWDEVAAIILAPVLSHNDVKTYPKSFWDHLARIRDEHGVLIIFDDILAGSGRAGYYASWQNIGLKPDVMTLAKGMAMGFPMSACLASEEIASAFTPGTHFNTCGGSPFVCHMMIAMYTWLDMHLGEIRRKGGYIRESWNKMEWIKSYDGQGMLNAFTPDYERFGYNGYQFTKKARGAGLCLATFRPHGSIRFTPPLNITMQSLGDALGMLERVHGELIG
jgi:acetylornithine/succinyldiaminopimelate/putrescine aminotransferase